MPLLMANLFFTLTFSFADPLPDSTSIVQENPVQLPTLEITATRIPVSFDKVPYSIDHLNVESLRGKPGLSLDETLREIPGISVSNRNNLSQGDRISIRGIGSRARFGVRGIRVLMDDIPLTMPDGQSQLHNLDLLNIGRIEVLRGSSSWLYGNAGGGVIHLHTKIPTHGSKIVPEIIIGSDGLQRWRTSYSYKSTNNNTLCLSMNRIKLNGYRDHSEALNHSINLVGTHVMSPNVSITSVLNIVDAPYMLNPSSLDHNTATSKPQSARFYIRSQGASKRLRQGQGGLTMTAQNNINRFQITLYGVSRTLKNPIPNRIIELDRRAGGLRSIFTRSLAVANRNARASMGFDVESQSDDRTEFKNEGIPDTLIDALPANKILDNVSYGERLLKQKEEVTGLGPFAALEVDILPKWTLSAGIRFDRYQFEVTDHHLIDETNDSGTRSLTKSSPSIGVVYKRNDYMTAFAHYASAFQTPTTVELGNRSDGGGGFNPDLDPETVHSFETGLRGSSPFRNLTYSIAFFQFTLNDMLVSFQNADEENFFRNTDKTSNKGFEGHVAFTPFAPIGFSVNYAFGNFIFDNVADEEAGKKLIGNQVPGVPRHQAWSQLTYRHEEFLGQLEIRRVGAYFANDYNGPKPGVEKALRDYRNESFITADARFSLELRGPISVRLFTGVNNLFDASYNGSVVPNAYGDRFFEPAPGRSFYLGCSTSVP